MVFLLSLGVSVPRAGAQDAGATAADEVSPSATEATAADGVSTEATAGTSTDETSATDSSAALHHHRNLSGTGPGPTGELVHRTQAENERLYQRLKALYMSPYCPGLTLGSCGSGAADLLRADLREWVFEGHKEKDITEYMIATFGEEIMGRPPFRGTAILVWLAPILAVLVGLWAAMRWVRKNVSRKGEMAEDSTPMDPQLDAQVEAEVRAHYR